MPVVALAFAAAAALALAAATPASAAAQPRLAEAAAARFPERAYALTLPAPRWLGPGAVHVTENGAPVDGVSVTPADGASAYRFGVVLAIDVSDSMRGRPLEGAIRAAKAFVRHRNPGQPVAVVTFAGAVRVTQPFTTDGATIERALSGIASGGRGTRLVDAVEQSLGLLRSARIGAGSIVLLTDGDDRGSRATLAAVSGAAARSGVRVFTIGLPSPETDFGTLNLLAAATHGEFSPATSLSDLTRVYERLGSRLASQYLIQYRSSARAGTPVRVRVRVDGVAGTAEADYRTPPIRPAPRPPFHPAPADRVWAAPATPVVASLIVALLVVLAVWLLVRPRGSSMRARLGAYVGPPEDDSRSRAEALGGRMLTGAQRSLDRIPWLARVGEALDVARMELTPARLAAYVAGATLLVLVALAAVAGVVGALASLMVPVIAWSLVSRRVAVQRRHFRDQLPDNLQVIASAMRAGHSLSAAVSVVVEDAPEPTRRELARVVADERLGVPIDESLKTVVRRMASKDLEQVALVASLQRETGGNTAEVLDRVTENVRERLELQRMVKTLTAQGRMSRWVVSLLPPGLLAILTAINPAYMRPLFVTKTGHVLLLVSTVLVVSGSLVIKKIVDIKV
jgi:tight adherence protein B